MSFELKQHPNRELTGGGLLAQTLKRIGTEVAFGVHGGHLDAFLIGYEHAGVKLVNTRHKTVAVQAAEGYAKVSGKLGVCFVTANSGFGNGLPRLATAPPLRDLENNSLQAFLDQVVVAKPITKFAHRVTHGEEVPRLVSEQLLALASAANIPVFQSPKFSPLPASHPNVAGLSNLLALACLKPDLVLLLDCRTGMFLGSRSGAIIPDSSKIIHVDLDGTEPGRTLPTALFITSSLSESYRAPDAWLQTAVGLQNIHSSHDDEPDYPTPSRVHPHKALSAFFRSLPPESINVSDGGEAGAWSFGLQHLAKPSLHMIPTGYLGFGYSLGAAIAKPECLVVNVQGDGSVGFHFMELDTYARFRVRVCTVVTNNSVWGMSAHGQELVYGEKNAARPATALKDVNVRVEKLQEVEKVVREVLGGEGPSCVDLRVSENPTHPGTTAMVGMTDDPNMVVVPYYDYVPRARYKL
ncbi:thiamine diphosphate-binding protein [Karstenula rhodostoma CBS 690.94]|uniref:Thiamine diphosphate-binding protein n=1 Tax=Karstenula rhodostoma CBS 690.94 TaxID=1392251 RepID=A0A9P4UG33_9PLEO|nr:thiamine diphosphate-binding protein [Karstenula rhodostoma CBS 690.94]